MSPERPPTPSTPECFGREKTPPRVTAAASPTAAIGDPAAAAARDAEEADSSGSSPASFVYQDHCYSLPPQEEPHLRGSLSPTPPPLSADRDPGLAEAEPEIPVKSKLKNVRISKPKVRYPQQWRKRLRLKWNWFIAVEIQNSRWINGYVKPKPRSRSWPPKPILLVILWKRWTSSMTS